MQERIDQELALLRTRHTDLEYRSDGHWIRILTYVLCPGWNRAETPVAFQIPVGFPGTPPYGFYVSAGLLFGGIKPNNYSEPAATPFAGTWGAFSWAPADGEWRPTSDPRTGSNLLNWTLGFAQRFREGV